MSECAHPYTNQPVQQSDEAFSHSVTDRFVGPEGRIWQVASRLWNIDADYTDPEGRRTYELSTTDAATPRVRKHVTERTLTEEFETPAERLGIPESKSRRATGGGA